MDTSESDEITLTELVNLIKIKSKLILTVTSIFFLVSTFTAFYLPNEYESEVIVAPANNQSEGSSVSSGVSGLAGLAGISLESPGISKVQEALEVLKSRKFLIDFINKYELKAQIMASSSWDDKSDTLIFNTNIYDKESGAWKEEPSDYQTVIKFNKYFLSFEEDKKTGFIKIAIMSLSPGLSKKWLDLLLYELNAYFRDQAINEANETISFLETQLEKAKFVEIRKSIFNLMQDQIKIITLAEGREEYLFRILDPAFVPEIHSKPIRLLIILLSTISGLLIILTYSLFNLMYKKSGQV
jgi:uncharacterized protein involved in exopolysaccharide biosynthesis